ncbi:MAG: hypothetical protein JSV34_06650, partial [Candidatus Omnitrophota bacterium]
KGDIVKIYGENLPSFVKIDNSEDGMLVLIISPGFEDAGIYKECKVIAEDLDGAKAETEFVITVNNVNRPPVIFPVSDITMEENQRGTISIVAYDLDKEDKLKVYGENLPPFAKVVDYDYGEVKIRKLLLTPTLGEAGIFNNCKIIVEDLSGARAETKFTITVEQALYRFPIILNQGWNFISLPIEPVNSNIEAVLKPIDGLYTQIRSQTQGRIYIPSKKRYMGDLKKMHAGEGYIIYIEKVPIEPPQFYILHIEGRLVDSEFPVLHEKWNWVGMMALETKNVTDVVDISEIGEIHTIRPGSGNEKLYYPKDFTRFDPGKGYKVNIMPRPSINKVRHLEGRSDIEELKVGISK